MIRYLLLRKLSVNQNSCQSFIWAHFSYLGYGLHVGVSQSHHHHPPIIVHGLEVSRGHECLVLLQIWEDWGGVVRETLIRASNVDQVTWVLDCLSCLLTPLPGIILLHSYTYNNMSALDKDSSAINWIQERGNFQWQFCPFISVSCFFLELKGNDFAH